MGVKTLARILHGLNTDQRFTEAQHPCSLWGEVRIAGLLLPKCHTDTPMWTINKGSCCDALCLINKVVGVYNPIFKGKKYYSEISPINEKIPENIVLVLTFYSKN